MATCKGLWVHVTTLTKPKFCQLFMDVHILIVDPQLTVDTSRAHLPRGGKLNFFFLNFLLLGK